MSNDFEIRITVDNIYKLKDEARRLAAQAVGAAAVNIEANAKVRCPWKTGRLRNSISAKKADADGLAWKVAPHTDYAIFVEFGTRYMAPRPYMTPAAYETFPSFKKAMEWVMKKAAERAEITITGGAGK